MKNQICVATFSPTTKGSGHRPNREEYRKSIQAQFDEHCPAAHSRDGWAEIRVHARLALEGKTSRKEPPEILVHPFQANQQCSAAEPTIASEA